MTFVKQNFQYLSCRKQMYPILNMLNAQIIVVDNLSKKLIIMFLLPLILSKINLLPLMLIIATSLKRLNNLFTN